jgi:hypothetical protein
MRFFPLLRSAILRIHKSGKYLDLSINWGKNCGKPANIINFGVTL